MKIEFLQDVDIDGKVDCFKREQFEAVEDGDFIMIHMKDDSTVKAPKDALGKYFKKVENTLIS